MAGPSGKRGRWEGATRLDGVGATAEPDTLVRVKSTYEPGLALIVRDYALHASQLRAADFFQGAFCTPTKNMQREEGRSGEITLEWNGSADAMEYALRLLYTPDKLCVPPPVANQENTSVARQALWLLPAATFLCHDVGIRFLTEQVLTHVTMHEVGEVMETARDRRFGNLHSALQQQFQRAVSDHSFGGASDGDAKLDCVMLALLGTITGNKRGQQRHNSGEPQSMTLEAAPQLLAMLQDCPWLVSRAELAASLKRCLAVKKIDSVLQLLGHERLRVALNHQHPRAEHSTMQRDVWQLVWMISREEALITDAELLDAFMPRPSGSATWSVADNTASMQVARREQYNMHIDESDVCPGCGNVVLDGYGECECPDEDFLYYHHLGSGPTREGEEYTPFYRVVEQMFEAARKSLAAAPRDHATLTRVTELMRYWWPRAQQMQLYDLEGGSTVLGSLQEMLQEMPCVFVCSMLWALHFDPELSTARERQVGLGHVHREIDLERRVATGTGVRFIPVPDQLWTPIMSFFKLLGSEQP